jgi:hypothetical protein
MSKVTTVNDAVIALNGSLSNAIEIGAVDAIGLVMPAAMDGTAITFAVCDTLGGTYVPLYDDFGSEVTVTYATSRAVALSGVLASLFPWKFIKIRTGTVGTPVVQTAARTIKVVTKG